MTKFSRAFAAAVCLAVLSLQVAPPSAADDVVTHECLTVRSEDGITAMRFAGANRYETAVCISRLSWRREWTKSVVLARGDKYPDALAGAPLAAQYEGPLLLTQTDAIPSDVLNEIQRILVPGRTVYLLGGTSAISDDVRGTLEDLGYQTERLAGANRYETAVEVAKRLSTSNFFFATGTDFPDALAAGNAAAAFTVIRRDDGDANTRAFAVLLTDGDSMPQHVVEFASMRASEYPDPIWFAVGGRANRAATDAFGDSALTDRFVGTNRYDTAAQVAEIFFDLNYPHRPFIGSHPPLDLTLATGSNFPDALAAAGTLGGMHAYPMILVQNFSIGDHGVRLLVDHGDSIESLLVVGGTSVVRDDIVDQAMQMLK